MVYIPHQHYQGSPPEKPSVWCNDCGEKHPVCRCCGAMLVKGPRGRFENHGAIGAIHSCHWDIGRLIECICGEIVLRFEDGCKYDQDPWGPHDHDGPKRQTVKPSAPKVIKGPCRPAPKPPAPKIIRLEDEDE